MPSRVDGNCLFHTLNNLEEISISKIERGYE